MRVQFLVKDPDVHCHIKEEAQEEFCRLYAEDGEYFCIEIDLNTLAGRLLPVKEWGR